VPRTDRRRGLVAAVLTATLVLGFAGAASVTCAGRGRQASQSAPSGDLLARLSGSLARGADADYTAEYSAGGVLVTVAQAPPRRAYRAAGSTYLVDPDSAYLCRATRSPVRCDRVPGADDLPLSHARAMSTAFTGGFVAAEYAVALLSKAAAEPGARTTAARQLVGGVKADCVAVTPVQGRPDTACASTGGVLVYFDGTTEAGTQVRVELRRITPAVAADAFDLPAGATVADVTALT
jgi:hypothetical protein